MLQDIKKLLKLKTYQPLNLIEISKEKLIHNYKVLSKINKDVRIAPVLKSNAYGHGLTLIAKVLDSHFRGNDKSGIPFFCVDSLFEAYELLKAKINTPILIMGYIDPENLKVKKLPFSYTVWDIVAAKTISKFQPQAGIHIFVDTGMGREGIRIDELPKFLEQLKSIPNLKVEGLMSHLASGELPNDPLTKLQIKNFQKAQEIVKKFGFYPKWNHLSNSDGALNNLNPNCNMARVGLALFGIGKIFPFHDSIEHRNGEKLNLKPILKLKTKLIQIKNLKPGDKVGYDGTFISKRVMKLGVLPIGYYDGVDRRLSNKAIVTIDEIECLIVGLISMNITTIDLTNITDLTIAKNVIIYSDNPSDKNSIENAAKICNTIPYDLLVHLADSTKRVAI